MDDRKLYIGGSEAAAVLGLSRWYTPLEVWAIKTGQVKEEDISQKIEVKLGNKLEDTVAELFTEETGKKVRRANETIFHPQYDFLGANIDRRVVGEESILECKTTSAWKYKEWQDEEIPIEYICQVMHYLMVTGAKKGYIACLIGNHKFVWKEILRDEVVILDMLKKEVHFWNAFIVPKIMPTTIKALDDEVLFKLYPEGQGEISLTDDANKIIESIEGAEQDLNALKKQIDEQKNILRAMLKENETGKTDRYIITWRNQETKRLDTALLKEKDIDIYNQYSKITKSRVLRINNIKEMKENG